MRVREVRTPTDYRRFLEVGDRAVGELGVPLLEPTLRSWLRGTSPHPTGVTLLLVEDDGRAVGRAVTHRDDAFDAKLGTRARLFGAVELGADEVTGRAVLACLTTELDQRARTAGETELIGPVSLLPNQAGGVITSGFEHRGFVDSAWNPEWVPGLYEEAGYTRWNESDTWIVPTDASAVVPTGAELAAAGITIQHAHRAEMSRLLPEVRDLVNASFAQLPYYTMISPAEFAAATDGLAWLVDPRLALIARDRAGAAVAFALVVPDITAFLQRTRGRLGPLQQVRLLLTRSRYRRDAVLIIQGTRPDRQGQGLLRLLSRELHAGLAAGGYQRMRSTYVGRDNPASAAQFARHGGRPLHGYTFYRRSVTP
ncbi:GNAT family N-acetyltransferase [Microbacterium gorillae]|uniref:hypothetical protein n=1 Tax=Microbacterium gorillae TaxID=1231063 RepID=UPI000ACAA511|nr:hypothetical protein [Microbacterium gorillae]